MLNDRLITGRFFSLAGEFIFSTAFAPAVLVLTGSVPLAALTVFLEWAPRTLLPLVGGYFIDHWSLRRQMLMIDAARILIALGVALAGNVEALLAGAMAIGFFNLWAMVAFERVLDLETQARTDVERHKRLRRFSLSQTTDRVARIAGAAIASLTLYLDSALTFAFVAAVLFLAGHLVSLSQKMPAITGGTDRSRFPLGKSIALTFSTPDISRLIVILFFLNAIQGLIIAIMPPLMVIQFSATPADIPIFFMILNASSVALTAVFPFASQRLGGRSVLALALIASFTGLCLSAFLPWQWPFVALVAVSIAMRGWYDIHLRLERNAVVPAEHLGRILLVFLPVIYLPFALGGLAAAMLSTVFSPYWVFVLAVGLGVLGLPFGRAFLTRSYKGGARVA